MDEILDEIKRLIERCEGAVMAVRGGDYLHSFSFCMQEKLRRLLIEEERFS